MGEIEEVLAGSRPWWVEQGGCLDVLKRLPDGCVQCCVTSPPYFGLRAYLKPGDLSAHLELGRESRPDCLAWARGEPGVCGECYVCKLTLVFREVRRVLHATGSLWLNVADSYASGQSGKPSNADFNVRYGNAPGNRKQESACVLAKSVSASCKAKDLLMVPAALAMSLRADGWFLRSEVTLCLSGGAIVYARTQKGDMPCMVKDLVRLRPETVQLWNGEKWTQVKGWARNPRPEDPLEIEVRTGERIGCTRDHLWPTQRGNIRADELRVGDVIATTRLPEKEGAARPGLLPDDEIGWLVGFYIAEGNLSEKAIRLSVHVEELEEFERIKFLAEAYHGTATMRRIHGNAATILVHGKVLLGIIRQYVSGSVSSDKRLTNACWQRSDAFLAAVLRGYLAGDGHWRKDNQWSVRFTTNDGLAQDLRTLGARTGAIVRLRRCLHTCNGRNYAGYRGTVRITPSQYHNVRSNGEVVAIRSSRARFFWDIEVEDEPHLFALASGILTHNCKVAPMPESVRDRPSRACERLYLLTKRSKYAYDQEAEREALAVEPHAPGNQKWANDDRNDGDRLGEVWGSSNGRNLWDWWEVPSEELEPGVPLEFALPPELMWWTPEPSKHKHYASFPTWLPRRCIRLGAPEYGVCPACLSPWRRVVERAAGVPATDRRQHLASTQRRGHPDYQEVNRPSTLGAGAGGDVPLPSRNTVSWLPTCTCPPADPIPALVLDPFAGSGTTGMVARGMNRRFLGIELSPEYATLARTRIADAVPLFDAPTLPKPAPQPTLFPEVFDA